MLMLLKLSIMLCLTNTEQEQKLNFSQQCGASIHICSQKTDAEDHQVLSWYDFYISFSLCHHVPIIHHFKLKAPLNSRGNCDFMVLQLR